MSEKLEMFYDNKKRFIFANLVDPSRQLMLIILLLHFQVYAINIKTKIKFSS